MNITTSNITSNQARAMAEKEANPVVSTKDYGTDFLRFLEVGCDDKKVAPQIVESLTEMSRTHRLSMFFKDVLSRAQTTVRVHRLN